MPGAAVHPLLNPGNPLLLRLIHLLLGSGAEEAVSRPTSSFNLHTPRQRSYRILWIA